MTERDIIGLVITYIYSFALLGAATLIQVKLNLPRDFTRKVVHVGAGMWIFGLYALFDSWFWGTFPIATYIVFNYISYKFKLIKAMDLSDSSPGTVYFVVSITVLLATFWSRGEFWIAATGIMAMTWGDAFASIVGRAVGKHPYYIGKHRRTFEGSAAMWGFSFAAMCLTMLFFSTGLDVVKILGIAIILASAATLMEAVALRGLDNIFVPVGSSMLLYLLVSTNANIGKILAGLALSTAIGIFAYRRKSLSLSGVLGAILTGTVIFGFGGWVMGLTLIAFFVYGTVLSKYKEGVKTRVAGEKFDKGSRRDMGQALANGGLGAVLAVLFFLNPDKLWLFAAFVGAMATVNADTWATELGVLSKRPPRLITSGKTVTPGTSGGITSVGTSATFAGGLAIGITVLILLALRTPFNPGFNWTALWWVVPAAALGGLLGSLSDSFMGATVQAMYTHAETGQETEKKFTRTGQKNAFRRGWQFMDNDAVNFISSGFGAAVAVGVFFLLTM
jgi:uncharacterized protein (TIGR00297 family)